MMYCGIDVAKLKHAVSLMDDKGQTLKAAFTITNTRSGFDQLLTELHNLTGEVSVGLEATGHYWLALYDELTRKGYPVIVLNPMQVAAYRKSGIRKTKSDVTDAVWIADYIRIANLPASELNLPAFLQLRELSRFRFRLTEQVGNLKRKLLTILDRVFPEYERLFSNVFLQASRSVLQEAVSAQEFADFNLQELTDILAEASRGRFGQEKAEKIQEQARNSVGVGFLTNAVHLEMQCLLAQLELLDDQRDQIDLAITELMNQIPQHITSIPGIGPVTGAAILAEIGDIQRFESVDKLVAYAGIDPSVYQTGQFEASETHMSKRGSPYLRHALWLAATAALLHDPSLKEYYQKKRNEGKHHGTALGAVCHKLLARIFVVLKEQRAYVIR
jgi:transposase